MLIVWMAAPRYRAPVCQGGIASRGCNAKYIDAVVTLSDFLETIVERKLYRRGVLKLNPANFFV